MYFSTLPRAGWNLKFKIQGKLNLQSNPNFKENNLQNANSVYKIIL